MIYADVLFFINFSMDFISLWAAALLGGRPRGALRMSLAAGIGGIYGVAGVVTELSGPAQYITAAAVSMLMCIVSFGMCGGFWGILKQSALIWGCGALLGGVMTVILSLGTQGSVYIPPGKSNVWLGAAAAAAVCVWVILRLVNAKKGVRQLALTVEYGEKKISFPALVDSGNLLRDPISGDPVILLSAVVAERLLGRETAQALLSCDGEMLAASGIRFRIIPIKNSSQSYLSAAFLPDKVLSKSGGATVPVRCFVALTDCSAEHFGGYPATAPPAMAP